MADAAVSRIELNEDNLELLLDLLESDEDFEKNIDKMIEEVYINLIM